MLQIVIFDDEDKDILITQKIIEEFIEKQGKQAVFHTFQKSGELLGFIRNNRNIDVVFMDILVKDEALGIELAKEINRISEYTEIVFLTGYIHYATDIYDTRHFYFVLKTELKERLTDVFNKLDRMTKANIPHTVYFKEKGYELILEEKEITYIERDKRVTYVHCKEQVHKLTDKISEIENIIHSSSFIRCHNSFLVNFEYVLKLKRTVLVLKDGTEIPISRARLNQVRQKFIEWSQRYI